jgi:hypothetical protein
MPAMFVLTSNLLTRRDQVNKLMWLIMVAIFIKCVFGAVYVVDVLKFNISKVNEITEHTGSILMDAFFIYTISVFMFRNSGLKRLLLPLMSIAVVITFVATQRRSAFVALFFAFAMIALILYREKKTLFWMIIPPATVLFIIYAGIFWNSSSSIALPIRAIKSQLAPNQISERDRASDSYRIAENYDLYSTIRRTPIFGTGFGHMFDMVVPLPDISFFVWWRYITHNSILWVWANIGIGGFLAMLMFVGMTIMTGVRVIFRMPEGALKSAAFTATFYMVMHFLFAYVDMSWDNQSMIMMGIMSGLIGCLEYIVAQPVALQSRRWSWQAEPASQPSLLPFPGNK